MFSRMLLLLLLQPLLSKAMPPEWNLPSMPSSWVLPSGNSHRCVSIPSSMKLCSNIGYTEMRLPNMLNHDTVNEVVEQTRHWENLANILCHKEIRVLLCSIYAPVCIPQLLDRQIKPCRSLCEAVKRPCSVLMTKYGYPWPDFLKCTQFPPDSDLMCIRGNKDTQPETNITEGCQSCPENVGYESIIGNYCANEVVFSARFKSVDALGDQTRIQLKQRVKFFKSANLTRHQKRSIRTVVLETVGNCQCRSLDAAKADPRKKLLIMGSLSTDGTSISVSYLVEWQRSPPFKRAMRLIRGGGGGGGGRRNRGRPAGGRRGVPADEDAGQGNTSLCLFSHELLPTALTSSAATVEPGRNRRKKKNRRKKNKGNRKSSRRAGSSPTAASVGGADDVETASGGDNSGGQRQRPKRRNRSDGEDRRSGYAYDSFYYTNYNGQS